MQSGAVMRMTLTVDCSSGTSAGSRIACGVATTAMCESTTRLPGMSTESTLETANPDQAVTDQPVHSHSVGYVDYNRRQTCVNTDI